MDWLTFKFCVLIWVLRVSKSKSQSQLLNFRSSFSNQLRSACEYGQHIVPPDECNSCICFAGQIYCTNIPCPEQDCVNGVDIPRPDVCNRCICRRGKVKCTDMICIPAPNCAEKQLYPAQNKCNACMCMNGFITCTSNLCAEELLPSTIPTTTTKKPKKKETCIEGASLPGPGLACIECFCQNGEKTCKNVCPTMESRFSEVETLQIPEPECVPGQYLQRPDNCNNCICFEGHIHCTHLPCRMDTGIEQDCVNGVDIPRPDVCNTCICRRGKVKCTNMICIPAPNCAEKQLYPAQNKCNTCMCMNGFITCTSNLCAEELLLSSIPTTTTKQPKKNEKCIEGESLPGPGLACIECFCQNGEKTCLNVCPTMESRFSEVETLQIPGPECVPGQDLQRPDHCNLLPSTIPTTTTKKPKKNENCIEGESLPGPGLACIECFCQNGEKTCLNVCPTMESRFSEVETLQIPGPECVPGQDLQRPDHCNLLPSSIPTTTTNKPKKKKCIEGASLPGPGLKCIECFCQNGKKMCMNVCPIMESRFSKVEPECIPGQNIQRPDPCNNCICIRGQVHCTHFPCRMDKRIGPECIDNQLVFRPDECNECYCFEGRLECSDLVCIRGSKCVQGQVIPKPDSCNACKCVEGHIMCTNYQCPILYSRNSLRPGRSSIEVRPLDECQDGDIISPPPPPNDCNKCYCMDNRIFCTMNSCEGFVPEIKGRLQEPNERTNLEIFDKKISVEPFINMISKNNEKLPTKLIHTHAYNGFHQEIKVHASHLPKDATKLLKVLATSLDNSALASISQNLLSSSHSLSNNHDSKIPLDNQVVPSKLLGEGNVLTTQSNKLITSGSQSNETILVIPNTEPLDDQDSQSVLPLTSKHETIWKSFSSPASQVFNNNQHINTQPNNPIPTIPHISQEEKRKTEKENKKYYDNPPSMLAPIDQNNVIRNPSKFGPPGLPHRLPTPSQPTRNIVEIPITNTQSIYPASNPKPNNFNDGKIGYASFSQENKQFKPIPSTFIIKQDELPDPRPYQLIKPVHNKIFNYTSFTPIFRPGKFIVTPNNNGGQQKPSQSQIIPNSSKYYTNHVKPQQIQFKPSQNLLLPLNNKGIQHPPLFKNPNPLIVAANQFKQPQIGLKPGQGSVSPLYNKGNQTDQQFKVFHPNQQQFQIKPPLINLPNQKKRISSTTNEGSKETPPHSMVPNSTAHHNNILSPPQIGVNPDHTQPISSHSQFVPNPSIYYRNEYESPKIIDVNPDQEQLIPHSKISYTHPEDPPHTSSEPDLHTLIPKVRNKTKIYNTSHSHYEKHTTITYVSEYDPTHPVNPLQIVHDPDQYQNAPQINVYENYLPDQESQELDLIMSKVNYYLNLPDLQLDQNEPHDKFTHYYPSQISYFPGQQLNYTPKLHPTLTETNKYNQHDSWNITNHQFDTYPHSPSDDNNIDPNSSSQSQFILSQDNSEKGDLNDLKSAEDPQSLSTSAEDFTHPKSNKLPPPSQTGSTQNQYPPGVFDDRWDPLVDTNGFQYSHNAYEDPRQLKPFHKLLASKLGAPQNQQLSGLLDERGSADGFQYPSHSAENPLQTKDNQYNHPHPQYGPIQNQHTPGIFDERGSADGFQYPSHSGENPLQPKDSQYNHPHPQYGPIQNQHTRGMFDEGESADGFHYPSNSGENPLHPKDKVNKLLHIQYGPTQNQKLPGMFDERGSTDGFQYPSHSAENPLQPKDSQYNHPHPQFAPIQNQHTPGMFDERGSADGFQYPSHSGENPLQPKDNQYNHPHPQYGPIQNQHTRGMFDEGESADGFHYPSHSGENPLHPKDKVNKLLHIQYGPTQNQKIPGVFDERGTADGFQYISSSAENLAYSKENPHKPSNSPFGPTTYKHLPGMYSSNSAGNPIHPKNLTHPEQNKQKQPHSQAGSDHNKLTPGMFAGRGSPDNFQYSSNSAKNHLLPKDYLHYSPHSQLGPPQNHHLPGVFDNRGSPGGFQYPSNSMVNPTQLKDNLHNPSHSPFLPSLNQYTSGVFDDRGSGGGFQYPSTSAENRTNSKDNLHNILPHSQFVPAQNQHKQTIHKQLNSPMGPTQNQHLPGMFDERGSADKFRHPSHSAENLLQPKDNQYNSPHPQFGPIQNQHREFDERGSADAFQYPSNSAENPTNPKQNKQKQPNSPFGPAQNQHLPGMFDERGSAHGFQYPTNSVENPTHPKDNLHILPQSQLVPSPNQHIPGVFDDRGSADGFQYPSNSAENLTHPKQNKQMRPNSPFGPAQNQHIPGVFDDRGSADSFQYPSNSAEYPTRPKQNKQMQPNSQFGPAQNQHIPGVFDDRGSADGFQYPSNSAENPTHTKQNNQIQSNSPFGPAHNQHLPGMFDERGSSDGFQYPTNSVENPTHTKDNLHKLPQSQLLPSPNQHIPGVFDDRGSADGFQYPSNSAENPTRPKQNKQMQPNSPFGPAQNQHLPGMFDERGSSDGFQYPSHSAENPLHANDNQLNPLHPQFGPNQNQHTPGVLDDRGSADGFHYPSNSAENPKHAKNNPNTTPDSKFQPQNQHKPSSLDDGYNNNNPLRPWMHLDHDQYKPSSFDNLLNGVHNIPWSFSGDNNKDSDTVTSAPEPMLTPDYDQYKPSSFDNLFNGIHQIPWSLPDQDNALGSDAEITTPPSGFKPKQDQYEPSMFTIPSISNQNENMDFTDVDDNQLQIEQDVSTPSTELTDSDSTQYNLLPKLKPDSDPYSLLLPDNGKILDYYDQLYPLFKAVKKLSDPPIDDSLFGVGSMDQLDLLPFLFPGIAKILNYEPSQDKGDVSLDENSEAQRINPLSKLKSKLKQLPENDNGILNWLKSKLNKLVPTKKDNTTVTKNDIDMTKIFNLLSKLTPPKLKHTTALQNIPFSGFDPEIIDNIMNDFKEDTLTTTLTPLTDSTHSYENRFMSDSTIPEESRPQVPQLKYPDVHIILHQPNDEDGVDLPQYIETDGELNPATDIDSTELSASMFPKMFNPRFRHRPKDQKEECGDGTQWISNCHGCSCYFGQAMCFRLPDCKLRPFGEPMTCKPYSHFKMGCYTCECNGDGVAECDASDCKTEPNGKSRVSGSTESPLPIFNEFFDSKKTNEIIQYYNFYKKLPKDCPKQDLQTQYPTCEPGTSWVSSCHKCKCNEAGKHECMKIDDCKLDFDSYGKPGQCKPNSKFYPKTNSMPCVECSCNDEGISYCPTVDYKKH